MRVFEIRSTRVPPEGQDQGAKMLGIVCLFVGGLGTVLVAWYFSGRV